ncbi:MAG: hypothetical protein IPP34_15815 [Bacteroidetes bacterium]|nr:hypothetical protein [Bacteroidota bacterium]
MIGDSIAGVLNDINAASKLIEQGYNRIRSFSWSISADKLLTIYKSI